MYQSPQQHIENNVWLFLRTLFPGNSMGNAILVGVSDDVTWKLQSDLQAAARLVSGVRWNEHITLRDTLHWLPWLPVWQRITYKIAMMAFRCIRVESPAYFSDVETVARRAKLFSARHGDLIVKPNNKYIRKVSALLPLLFGIVSTSPSSK